VSSTVGTARARGCGAPPDAALRGTRAAAGHRAALCLGGEVKGLYYGETAARAAGYTSMMPSAYGAALDLFRPLPRAVQDGKDVHGLSPDTVGDDRGLRGDHELTGVAYPLYLRSLRGEFDPIRPNLRISRRPEGLFLLSSPLALPPILTFPLQGGRVRKNFPLAGGKGNRLLAQGVTA